MSKQFNEAVELCERFDLCTYDLKAAAELARLELARLKMLDEIQRDLNTVKTNDSAVPEVKE